MLVSLSNFIITEWIWSFTGGFSHLPLNFLLLFLLFKLWDHMSWFRAFIISFVLTVGAFLLFFCTIWIALWALRITYMLPDDAYMGSYDILNTSLILAACYASIQMAGVWYMRHWISFNVWRAYACILSSNIMSAILVYKITFEA